MPTLGEFRINENRLQEVLRVKSELYNVPMTAKKPTTKVNTIQPSEELNQSEWYQHLHNTLREYEKVPKEEDILGSINNCLVVEISA